MRTISSMDNSSPGGGTKPAKPLHLVAVGHLLDLPEHRAHGRHVVAPLNRVPTMLQAMGFQDPAGLRGDQVAPEVVAEVPLRLRQGQVTAGEVEVTGVDRLHRQCIGLEPHGLALDAETFEDLDRDVERNLVDRQPQGFSVVATVKTKGG
jgi:hypothetical protein